MANRKITEFVSLTQPAGDDVFPIVDVSEALDVDKNKKITVAEIFKSIPSGSAAAPGIAFEGNDSVGIYRPGTDQLAISTGGTGRLFVDASGNVGIGTGSPAAALHLAGTATQRFTNTTNTSGFDIGLLGGSADVNAYIYNRGNGALVVGTNNVERLRVTNTGQVYIPHTVTSLATTIAINNTDATSGTGNRIAFQSNGTNVGTFDWDYTGGVFNTTIGSYGNLIFKTNGASPTERLRITSTGQIQSAGLGSAASPALSFTTDTNTGIYSPGADQLAISTGGSGRLFVDADGEVGIGTGSPDGLLTLAGANSNVPRFRIQHPSSDRDAAISTYFDGSGTYLLTGSNHYFNLAGSNAKFDATSGSSAWYLDGSGVGIFYNSSGSGSITERFRIRADGTFEIKGGGTAGSSPAFSVNPSASANSLVIDSSGRLGVGTSSPSNLLDVRATSATAIYCENNGGATNNATQSALTVAGRTTGARAVGFATGLSFQHQDSSGAYAGCQIASVPNADLNTANLVIRSRNYGYTDVATFDSSGRLGIGTSSPGAIFHAQSASGPVGIFYYAGGSLASPTTNTVLTLRDISYGATTTTKFNFTDANAYEQVYIGAEHNASLNGSGSLVFGTASGNTGATERLRITAGGLVGIGTTSPAKQLHVEATSSDVTLRIGRNGYVQTDLIGSTGAGANDFKITQNGFDRFVIEYGGNSAARIDSSGRLLVGTSTGRSVYGSNAQVQLEGTTYPTTAFNLIANSNANSGTAPYVQFARSRGTANGSNTIVQAGDRLGGIAWCGANGSNLDTPAAAIEGLVDTGTPSATSMPGRIVLSTTADGAGSVTERMRITSAGNVGINSTLSGNANNQVLIRKNSNSAIVDALLLNNGNADNNAGTGVRINFSGVSEANSHLRYAYIESATTSSGNDHYLAFGTNSAAAAPVERLRITSAGNVGIGTSSASAPLAFGKAVYAAPSSEDFYRVKFEDVGGIANDVGLGQAGSGTLGLNCAATGNVIFYKGGTETVRVDSSGRVGIGTSSPGAPLDVNGAIYSRSTGVYTDTITSYTGSSISVNAGSSNINFIVNASERARIDSSGRLGLGTSSPSSYDFNGPVVLAAANTAGSSTISVISDAASLGQLAFADGTTGTTRYRGLLEYNHSTDAFQIRTAGAPAVTIDSSQRVGIGTTSPASVLHVNQPGDNNGITVSHATRTGIWKLVHSGVNSQNFAFIQNNGTSDAVSFIAGRDSHEWHTGGTLKATIDSSGRLLVGTSTARTNFFNTASTFAPLLQIESATDANRFQSLIYNSSSAEATHFCFGKTRGTTVGSNTVVASGDDLGAVSFLGSDGSEFVEAARIQTQVDGTPGANDMPGRLIFSTTADGAFSPTERMRITSDGNVGIGKTSTKYKLDASEARIGDGCVIYSKNITKTAGTTHTATISFESQGSAWEPKHIEVMFAGSLGSSSTAYAGIARYMFTTNTSVGTITELEDSGNGVSFAAAASGMDVTITATTTANNSYIGFTVRVVCGGSGGGFPTGMTIA